MPASAPIQTQTFTRSGMQPHPPHPHAHTHTHTHTHTCVSGLRNLRTLRLCHNRLTSLPPSASDREVSAALPKPHPTLSYTKPVRKPQSPGLPAAWRPRLDPPPRMYVHITRTHTNTHRRTGRRCSIWTCRTISSQCFLAPAPPITTQVCIDPREQSNIRPICVQPIVLGSVASPMNPKNK